MGLRALRWWRRDRPRGLKTGQICIMWEAAYSCMDDTAWLAVDVLWFVGKAGGLRTIERQLPRLAELELLVRGAGGFRLPRFFAFDRQNGGTCLDSSDNLTANLAESFPPHPLSKNTEGGLGKNPPTPLAGGLLKLRPSEERKRARFRADFAQTYELQENTTARCTWCDPPHDWTLSEVYISESQPEWMCPEFRKSGVKA